MNSSNCGTGSITGVVIVRKSAIKARHLFPDRSAVMEYAWPGLAVNLTWALELL
jgi:hypothetical protein